MKKIPIVCEGMPWLWVLIVNAVWKFNLDISRGSFSLLNLLALFCLENFNCLWRKCHNFPLILSVYYCFMFDSGFGAIYSHGIEHYLSCEMGIVGLYSLQSGKFSSSWKLNCRWTILDFWILQDWYTVSSYSKGIDFIVNYLFFFFFYISLLIRGAECFSRCSCHGMS